jgi:hypothetical protein
MKPEEIAVLRILYKHKTPLKFSALVEGFPDDSMSCIVDAVAALQRLSVVCLTECSSILYVSINRQMRRDVLGLLEDDSERYEVKKLTENEIRLNASTVQRTCRGIESSSKSNLRIFENRELLLRIPKRAVKLSTSILICSFLILGSIAALNSQSTTSSVTSASDDDYMPIMFTGSSSLVTMLQNGKSIPVAHNSNSEQNLEYLGKSATYEGIITKTASGVTHDDPSLYYYYYYVISEEPNILILGSIDAIINARGSLNSSQSTVSDSNVKEFSLT